MGSDARGYWLRVGSGDEWQTAALRRLVARGVLRRGGSKIKPALTPAPPAASIEGRAATAAYWEQRASLANTSGERAQAKRNAKLWRWMVSNPGTTIADAAKATRSKR